MDDNNAVDENIDINIVCQTFRESVDTMCNTIKHLDRNRNILCITFFLTIMVILIFLYLVMVTPI